MDKVIFKDSKVADEAKRNVKGSQIVKILKEKHSIILMSKIMQKERINLTWSQVELF